MKHLTHVLLLGGLLLALLFAYRSHRSVDRLQARLAALHQTLAALRQERDLLQQRLAARADTLAAVRLQVARLTATRDSMDRALALTLQDLEEWKDAPSPVYAGTDRDLRDELDRLVRRRLARPTPR